MCSQKGMTSRLHFGSRRTFNTSWNNLVHHTCPRSHHLVKESKKGNSPHLIYQTQKRHRQQYDTTLTLYSRPCMHLVRVRISRQYKYIKVMLGCFFFIISFIIIIIVMLLPFISINISTWHELSWHQVWERDVAQNFCEWISQKWLFAYKFFFIIYIK